MEIVGDLTFDVSDVQRPILHAGDFSNAPIPRLQFPTVRTIEVSFPPLVVTERSV